MGARPLSALGGLLRDSGLLKLVHSLTHALSSIGSFKFGQKIFYVNYLSELSEHVKLEQLGIPRQVLKYDDFLKSTQKSPATAPKPMPPRPPLPNQQFGVSLQQ